MEETAIHYAKKTNIYSIYSIKMKKIKSNTGMWNIKTRIAQTKQDVKIISQLSIIHLLETIMLFITIINLFYRNGAFKSKKIFKR